MPSSIAGTGLPGISVPLLLRLSRDKTRSYNPLRLVLKRINEFPERLTAHGRHVRKVVHGNRRGGRNGTRSRAWPFLRGQWDAFLCRIPPGLHLQDPLESRQLSLPRMRRLQALHRIGYETRQYLPEGARVPESMASLRKWKPRSLSPLPRNFCR